MDDILVFTKDNETHLGKVEEVKKRLEMANLEIKVIKCRSLTDNVKFLGYKMTGEGMSTDEDRKKSLTDLNVFHDFEIFVIINF